MIVAGRHDGLGSRLANILVAESIATIRQEKIAHLWSELPESHNIRGGSIEDIFSGETLNKFVILNENRNEEYITSLFPQSSIERIKNVEITGTDLLELDKLNINFKKIFRSFEFSKTMTSLMAKVDKFFSNHPDRESLIALHYRGGDVEKEVYKWFPHKYLPFEFYEELLKRMPFKDKSIYFATNQLEKINELKKNYSLLVLEDILGEEFLNSYQKDFLEIYILSQFSKIYAPHGSLFSRVACMIGQSEIVDIGQYVLGNKLMQSFKVLIYKTHNQALS
jgi:hypothetical protein